MKEKRLSLPMIVLCICWSLSNESLASEPDGCITENRILVGHVAKEKPYTETIVGECQFEKSCVGFQLSLSQVQRNVLEYNIRNCRFMNDADSECGDWRFFARQSPYSPESHPATEKIVYSYPTHIRDSTIIRKVQLILDNSKLATGDYTKIQAVSEQIKNECVKSETRTTVKTTPDHVRDELNPYLGGHPEALMVAK